MLRIIQYTLTKTVDDESHEVYDLNVYRDDGFEVSIEKIIEILIKKYEVFN